MNYYEKYIKYKIKYLRLKKLKDNSIVKLNSNFIKTVYKDVNEENIDKLKFTKESIYSMCRIHGTEFLLRTIKRYFSDTKNLIITDGTANVGSASINISDSFKLVNSIEISPINYNALVNNINVLGKNNIKTFLADTNIQINKLNQDIIYIDAPWEGRNYKEKESLDLFLGNVSIDKFYEKNKDLAKMFIFKVPINYNIQKLQNIAKIKIHKYFRKNTLKYFLIVIDNR